MLPDQLQHLAAAILRLVVALDRNSAKVALHYPTTLVTPRDRYCRTPHSSFRHLTFPAAARFRPSS